MSIFNELNQDYTSWREKYFRNRKNAASFLHALSEGFRKYIGAPESFFDVEDRTKPIPYVRVIEAIEQEDGTFRGGEQVSIGRGLETNDEGKFVVMLTTVLEIDTRTWPKQQFAVLLRFRLDGNRCEMLVGPAKNGPVTMQIDDPSTFTRAYVEAVAHYRAAFSVPPGVRVDGRRPIGYRAPLE